MATVAKTKTKTQSAATGKISQVIGAVVDVSTRRHQPRDAERRSRVH